MFGRLRQLVARVGECAQNLHQLSHLAAERTYALRVQAEDPRSLLRHGFKVYSQNEEDGLIHEIFRRIGTTNRRFIEFGAGEGLENNTLSLLLQGWSGSWIEGHAPHVQTIRRRCRRLIDAGRLVVEEAYVETGNVEALFNKCAAPAAPDLLSIDIDGNDYWVWKSITRFTPRVVVIEYNAGFGPVVEWVMNEDRHHRWRHTRYFGASLKSLELLGRAQGYALVGCNFTGVNAFFVRDDCVGDRFLAPFDSATHFQPPRRLQFWTGWPVDEREIGSFPP